MFCLIPFTKNLVEEKIITLVKKQKTIYFGTQVVNGPGC